MAYVTGNIPLSSNIQLSKHSPLDARQVVGNNVDLNDIGGFPYDGLIVHVKDTDKTYVCIDETKAKDGDGVTDPGGVIDEAVWKEVGAGSAAATTVTLEDEDPAPTGAADKVILYSADETSAESMPDHLYLFNEGATDDVAIDSGRNGVNGLKSTTRDPEFFTTGALVPSGFGYSELFDKSYSDSVRVGGVNAPYYMTGAGTGQRADFELQFYFNIGSTTSGINALLSSDPPTHTRTAGFYSVLLNKLGAGTSTIIFEYFSDQTSALETLTWKIPGTLAPATNSVANHHHVVISFFEDDRGFDTAAVSPSVGKFRCYLDGIVLEDQDTADAFSIPGSFVELGRVGGSNPPVYLGQYLNGATAPAPIVLFHFDDGWDNSGDGGNATAALPPAFQTSTVTGTGFGKQIDFDNTANAVASEYITIPDPIIGTGPFTFECWFNIDTSTTNQTFFSEGGSTGDGSNPWGDVTFATRIDGYTDNQNGFVLWGCSTSTFEYVYWGDTSTGDLWTAGGGMKHLALVRQTASGGNSQWVLYVNGQYIAPNGQGPGSYGPMLGNLPTVDMGGQAYQVGRIAHNAGTTEYAFDGQMDELRISKSDTIYSGTSSFTVPVVPFQSAPDPSTRFLEGKMHEFAVWNHRCLHNTSDKFAPISAPTRSTPLSVASVVDSENTSSPILTTSNLGMLLPKAVEGLADGTAWNDKGVVKIAPLTGDLDSVPDPVVDNVLSLSARTTPAAGAGVAKIYAKTSVVAATPAEVMFHLNGDVQDSSLNANHGTANSITYVASEAGASETYFGNAAVFDGSNQTSTGDSFFTFDRVAVGTSNFTISFWISLDSVADTQWNTILSTSNNTWGAEAFMLTFGSWDTAGSSELRMSYEDGSGGFIHDKETLTMTANVWYHIAVVRSGDDHAFYLGTAGQTQGNRVYNVNHTARSFSGTNASGDSWSCGKLRSSGFGSYNLSAKLDELVVSKEVLPPYVGLGTTYTIPDAPYSAASSNIAKLYAMDSDGNETQLTP